MAWNYWNPAWSKSTSGGPAWPPPGTTGRQLVTAVLPVNPDPPATETEIATTQQRHGGGDRARKPRSPRRRAMLHHSAVQSAARVLAVKDPAEVGLIRRLDAVGQRVTSRHYAGPRAAWASLCAGQVTEPETAVPCVMTGGRVAGSGWAPRLWLWRLSRSCLPTLRARRPCSGGWGRVSTRRCLPTTAR
jgi:hypothetical protein